MNSIVARLLLSSTVFLLPLIVAAQPDDSDDSLTLTAHDPETGEALPTQDGKASIVGTPGDGVPDAFNYIVRIANTTGDEPGRLKIEVATFDTDEMDDADEMELRELGVDVIEEIVFVGEDAILMRGHIDLSSDTEFGQMLRYMGRLDFPSGRAATFEHDVTVGCQCPRAGSWTATNFAGTMVCTGGNANLTIPLVASTQTATLGVYNGCRTLHVTNFDDDYAVVPMQRVPGECGYEGVAEGEDMPMVIRFTMDVHEADSGSAYSELITGSLRSEFVQGGTTCIMARDFEVRFND